MRVVTKLFIAVSLFLLLTGGIMQSDRPFFKNDNKYVSMTEKKFAIFYEKEFEIFSKYDDSKAYYSNRFDNVIIVDQSSGGYGNFVLIQAQYKIDKKYYYIIARSKDGREYSMMETDPTKMDTLSVKRAQEIIKLKGNNFNPISSVSIGLLPRYFNDSSGKYFRFVPMDTELGRKEVTTLTTNIKNLGEYDAAKVDVRAREALFETASRRVGGITKLRQSCTVGDLSFSFQSAGRELYNRGKLIDVYYSDGSCFIKTVFGNTVKLFFGIDERTFECQGNECEFELRFACQTNGNPNALCPEQSSNDRRWVVTAQKNENGTYRLVNIK